MSNGTFSGKGSAGFEAAPGLRGLGRREGTSASEATLPGVMQAAVSVGSNGR